MTNPMLPRERCEYSAIVDRPKLKLPNGAKTIIKIGRGFPFLV
jgi:allantoinase